jgi:hypothetical protein
MSKLHIVLGNGLHCIHEGKTVNVYTEEEYKDLELQNSWWNRAKKTLTSLGADASWALKN